MCSPIPHTHTSSLHHMQYQKANYESHDFESWRMRLFSICMFSQLGSTHYLVLKGQYTLVHKSLIACITIQEFQQYHYFPAFLQIQVDSTVQFQIEMLVYPHPRLLPPHFKYWMQQKLGMSCRMSLMLTSVQLIRVACETTKKHCYVCEILPQNHLQLHIRGN